MQGLTLVIVGVTVSPCSDAIFGQAMQCRWKANNCDFCDGIEFECGNPLLGWSTSLYYLCTAGKVTRQSAVIYIYYQAGHHSIPTTNRRDFGNLWRNSVQQDLLLVGRSEWHILEVYPTCRSKFDKGKKVFIEIVSCGWLGHTGAALFCIEKVGPQGYCACRWIPLLLPGSLLRYQQEFPWHASIGYTVTRVLSIILWHWCPEWFSSIKKPWGLQNYSMTIGQDEVELYATSQWHLHCHRRRIFYFFRFERACSHHSVVVEPQT